MRVIIFAALISVAPVQGDLNQSAYDEDNAHLYAQYARAAFCTESAVEAWSCGRACSEAPVVPGSVRFVGPTEFWEVQGFVAQLPGPPAGTCIVAFRGSLGIWNWIADADFFLEPWPLEEAAWCPGCEVHTGFANAYREVRAPLHAALRNLSCTSASAAGHSLGAALVTLASLELRAELGLQVEKVYTFGSPRVGNHAFVAAYLAAAAKQGAHPSLWRVVHYLDPAVRVPPPDLVKAMGLGDYAHIPHEVYYTDRASSHFEECTDVDGSQLVNTYEDPNCSWAHSLLDCINLDHLTYLNESFAYKSMSHQCKRTGLPEDNLTKLVFA